MEKYIPSAFVCTLLIRASLATVGAPSPTYAPALAPLAASGAKLSAAASRVARDLPVLSEWANAAATSGTIADAPFTASTFYAYDYRKHLPFELPEEAGPATSLSMHLAKGEFEGETLMLHPVRDVRKLDISAEPLVCGGMKLPPEALDIRAPAASATEQSVEYWRVSPMEAYYKFLTPKEETFQPREPASDPGDIDSVGTDAPSLELDEEALF